jgi:hypothetical protein
MELDWMTAQQAADKWGITSRRVQALCKNGQIEGVVRLGNAWLIPKGISKPRDGRYKNGSIPTENKPATKRTEASEDNDKV